MDDDTDICRVCRCEASVDQPLFHPCKCNGSLKFIHQECLVQWLRVSKRDFCEVCNYRFSFTPTYAPDMPERLPLNLILFGLAGTVGRAVKFCLYYTLVAVAWLGVVPLMACKIYRTLFTGSVSTILSLPINVFSTENLAADILLGYAVVTLSLLAFIGLTRLVHDILHHGGGPAWLLLHDAAQVPGLLGLERLLWRLLGRLLDRRVLLGEPPRARDNEGPQPDLMQNVPEEPAAPEIVDPAAEVPWLVFLKHVFLVLSLNTVFILIFAFCPYHIGNFALAGFKMKHVTNGIHFEGLTITIVGYCMIGFSLVILHAASSFFKFKRSARELGICYVVVKVVLLLTAEILAFPVICGWWLDVCSLSLFDASLKDRLISFQTAPWATIFMHWLLGMFYVFYSAGINMELRGVLRPGVLWFLRNLNDPNFKPIQEMIRLSLVRHVRRFCASLIMFGTSILVMFYCPSRVISSSLPSFLPSFLLPHLIHHAENLRGELLFLNYISLSAFFCIYLTMTKWCGLASWALGIRSYMFGDVALDARNNQILVLHVADPPPEVDQAQPYNKPAYFWARICGLLGLMVVSLLLISLVMMAVPVCFVWTVVFVVRVVEGHDVYDLFTGLFVCLLLAGGCLLLARAWLSQGWAALGHKLRQWATIGGKAAVAVVLLMGIIPLMYGILLEMVVFTPLRVPLHQSPVCFQWLDWFDFARYTMITVAVTFMGPDWWLKIAIQQLYQDGIRNINLHRLIHNLVVPCVTRLGLALSLPYITSHGLTPLIVSDFHTLVLIQRRIYPFLPLAALFGSLLMLLIKQFVKLVEHMKNDRYLVGRRLDNNDQPHQNLAVPV